MEQSELGELQARLQALRQGAPGAAPGVPRGVGVTGESEAAEADELNRVYHLAYTNAVTHSKNMDHLFAQQVASQNYALSLAQLAQSEKQLADTPTDIAATNILLRGTAKEADIGSTPREAILAGLGSLSQMVPAVEIENLRRNVSDVVAGMQSLTGIVQALTSSTEGTTTTTTRGRAKRKSMKRKSVSKAKSKRAPRATKR